MYLMSTMATGPEPWIGNYILAADWGEEGNNLPNSAVLPPPLLAENACQRHI